MVCRESCFVSTYLCSFRQEKVLTVWHVLNPSFHILPCMRVWFLSHAQFAYACFKPDIRWCHMQLLRGWQTVSAPQHGALWSACQADWQVNDTNENQQSLPLGARRWVTASKQPERVSLNLKVISLTRSLLLSLFWVSVFLLFPLASLSFAFFWLLYFSPPFQANLFLFLSVGIFHFKWRFLSFLNCLQSPPSLSIFLLPVIASCCLLSLCHRL